MSQAATKEAIHSAIATPNTPVIALTGDWGTGKTHLWRSLSVELETQQGYSMLSLSALAFKSVDDLKTAITTHVVSRYASVKTSNAANKFALSNLAPWLSLGAEKATKRAADIGKHFLPSGLQVRISDTYVFLPKMRDALPEKFIIAIDDIERTEKLDVSELLGFVNFLVEDVKLRLVLILNTSQLRDDQRAHWEKMREKIVSRSVELKITPEEAANFALTGLPPRETEAIKQYAAKLGLRNIRITQHIRRNWETIRGARELDDVALDTLIKSIVLFTALHLKTPALADWPTIPDIVKGDYFYGSDEDKEQINTWRQYMSDYNFGVADDFEEKILVPFLETGHLNSIALDAYLKDIQLRTERDKIEQALRKVYLCHHWDVHATPDSIVSSIRSLSANLVAMTPKQATEAVKLAEDYDAAEANALMDAWLSSNREMIMQADIQEHFHDNLDHLHSRIAALYEERRRELYPPMSVIEAIQHYHENSGYGDRQREAIGAASIEYFEQLIRNAPPEDQRELFRFFEPIANNRRVGTDFGPATDRFFQAVSNVIERDPESGAARVWLRALKAKKMEGFLRKSRPAEPASA